MKKHQSVAHPSAWSDKALRGLVMSDSWMRRKKFMRSHASPLRRRITRAVRQLRKKYWTQEVIVVRLDT